MNRRLSRRRFLQWAAAAGLALASCQSDPRGPLSTALATVQPPLPTQPPAVRTRPPLDEIPQGSLFVLDAHEDVAWNALEFGRDPLQDAASSRAREERSGVAAAVGERATSLPDWLAGSVALVFATLFAMPASRDQSGGRLGGLYRTPEEAGNLVRSQLAYYQDLVGRSGQRLRLVTARADLQAVLDSRFEGRLTQVGLVMLMEGAEAVAAPAELPEWHAAGLRLLGPAWAATRYAGSSNEPGPLTELGIQLLAEMEKLNLLLDLSHLSEQASLQTLERYGGPVAATHAVPRRFIGSERGLSDQQIRQLAARDGVVGILPVNYVLQPGWLPADPPLPLSRTVEAIDYVAQLTGSIRHVGIGTDFDGGFGPNYLPQGVESVAGLAKNLRPELEKRGYSWADLQAIFAGNFLRLLGAAYRRESGMGVRQSFGRRIP